MIKKDATQVVVVAEFRAKDGKTEELVDALHVLVEPTHREPGCVRYELNQRTDDPRWITFIEEWENRAFFDQHRGTPYIAGFFNVVRPALVETYEVKLYE